MIIYLKRKKLKHIKMHFRLLILLLSTPIISFSQTLYDPQQSYDLPGGLFETDSIRDLYLNFYDPNYHSSLVYLWYYAPSERIPAQLTLNGVLYDSVGVRYKGNSTFCLPNDNNNPKVPYNIDMNYFISGQKLLEYKKIKLANAWMDPTFLKEIIASSIYRKYLPSGQANLMKLHVQGNYLGLYVNAESINKQFLMKHFGEKSGPLFKCDNIDRFCDTSGAPQALPPDLQYLGDDTTLYYNSYDLKSDFGWSSLMDLTKTLKYNYNELDSVLNIDRTLWAFAVNQVLLNLDCYNTYYIHNYYLYQTEDGLFQMIPWDLDNSFTGAIMGWDYWNPSNVYEYDPYHYGSPGQRPLAEKLLNDPFYRKVYTAHLRTIVNESLDTAIIRSNINTLQSLAYNAADNDFNKLFSMQQYFSNVDAPIWTGWGFGGIMSSIDARKQFLLSHPEISLSPPTLYGLNISDNVVSISSFNETDVKLMITDNEYASKFQSYQMYDDGTNGDAISGDNIYSTYIPFNGNTDVKFYIRAENDDAVMLYPERAEYEFYEYSTISNIFEVNNQKKSLLYITDLLGRKVDPTIGKPLIFIYNNGEVEKRIIY